MVSLILRSSLRFSLVEGQMVSQNQPKLLGSIEWHNHRLNRAKKNSKIQVLNNSLSFSEIKLKQGELEVWLDFNESLRSWMMIGQERFLRLNSAKLVEILKQGYLMTMYQSYSVHSISTEMVY